ncbi:MAG: 3-phosphoshikimate 1-carboxyvinyltransferase [Planctomycetota bacterium]
MQGTDQAIQTLKLPLGELPDPLPVPAYARSAGRAAIDVTVRPPGSKSLTNRAMLLAGLADGESVLRGALVDADDALRMREALTALGATVTVEPGEGSKPPAVRIRGVGGRWPVGPGGAEVFLNNAGTATRFLAAGALLADGPVTIDGNERMRQRPIGELIKALRDLGARVDENGDPGCPPITIHPPPPSRLRGAEVAFGVTQSSQFISAVLLAGTCFEDGVTVHLGDHITSQSYVQMTVDLLQAAGVTVKTATGLRVVRVLPGLKGFEADIEPDASGATYFWAAAAMVPGAVCRVTGLSEGSLQGDAQFPRMLERLGAPVDARENSIAVTGPATLRPVMADMSDMPDAAVTLAVVAAFAEGTSVLRGVSTLRVKETDRIEALRNELAKIGAVVETDVNDDPGTMTVSRAHADQAGDVHFDTYDDHRMAMATALVALRRGGVHINDPGCVAKTYSSYFQTLAKLYS